MAGGGVALDGDGHSEVDAAGEGNVSEGEEGGDEEDKLLGLQKIGKELGQAEQQHRQHWGHKLYCTNGHHHEMELSTLGSGDIVLVWTESLYSQCIDCLYRRGRSQPARPATGGNPFGTSCV